jgi:hypothetical protein
VLFCHQCFCLFCAVIWVHPSLRDDTLLFSCFGYLSQLWLGEDTATTWVPASRIVSLDFEWIHLSHWQDLLGIQRIHLFTKEGTSELHPHFVVMKVLVCLLALPPL